MDTLPHALSHENQLTDIASFQPSFSRHQPPARAWQFPSKRVFCCRPLAMRIPSDHWLRAKFTDQVVIANDCYCHACRWSSGSGNHTRRALQAAQLSPSSTLAASSSGSAPSMQCCSSPNPNANAARLSSHNSISRLPGWPLSPRAGSPRFC